MLNQPASPTRQLGRYLLAAPLLLALALGYSSARAQVAPTPAPATRPAPGNVAYYIDGKLVSAAEANALDPTSILAIDRVKDPAQTRLLGPAAAGGAALITTKAQASSPAVLAFNKRFPVTPATAAQNAATAAATAYLTQNYPGAQLQSVGPATGQPGRYRAVFTAAGQRLQLLFDGQGHPVAQ